MPYTVYIGAFHPHLESTFLKRIREVRQEGGPLDPLIIVTPSSHLLERLQWVLGREGSWLALQFFTLHGLALRVIEDAAVVPAPAPSALMLREIIRAHLKAGGGRLSLLADHQAGPDSVSSTLRDLQEGRVDIPTARLWLKDQIDRETGRMMELSEKEEIANTCGLMEFFSNLSDSLLERKVVTEALLTEKAVENVPQSGFLSGAARIFYYGFYDLTQVQTDLFHAIASNHQVEAFIPIAVDPRGKAPPAYEYAGRYFDTFLRGLAKEVVFCSGPDPSPLSTLHTRLFDVPSGHPVQPDSFHIVSVSGSEDEARTAAKWILRAHEDQSIPFSEIGLVARNLGGSWSRLRRILGEHGIPYTTPEQRPASEHRLTQTLLKLPELILDGFRRGAVIDLLSSPYFRIPDSVRRDAGRTFNISGGQEVRDGVESAVRREPAAWDYASRLAGITTPESWEERLGNLAEKAPVESDDTTGPRVSRKSIETLLRLVQDLRRGIDSLAGPDTWAEHARRLRGIVSERLVVPPPGESATEEEAAIMEQFIAVLTDCDRLDGLLPRVSTHDFYRSLDHALRGIELPAGPPRADGVKVLTAMSARGHAFDLLILLGMNSKGFPRPVQEDPLLRDRSRGLITHRARKEIEKLGHHMRLAEKIAGHEEDRLLLSLLVNAARRQLVVLYQRSDEEGSPALASPFVRELQRAAAGASTPRAEIRVPRPDHQKNLPEHSPTAELWTPGRATPREIAVASVLAGGPIETIEPLLGYPAQSLRASLGALKEIETWAMPGAFDGKIRLPARFVKTFPKRGFSPSLLERYVACPFRFFAERLLELDPWPDVEEDDWPTPMLLGNFVHSVLARFGRWLDESGHLQGRNPDWRAALLEAFDETNVAFADEPGRGYPAVWDARTGVIRDLLLNRVVPMDLERLEKLEASRILVEKKASAELDLDTAGAERRVRLTGRVDRLALLGPRESPHAVEVIDWKFKMSKKDGYLKSSWQNAARGRNLQPPIYALLAKEILHDEGIRAHAEVHSRLVPIGPRLEDEPFRLEPFTNEDWSGERGTRLRSLLAGIVHRIREGDFQLRPGGAYSPCDRCEYRIMCRRDHSPSRRRAENGTTFGWLEEVARTDKPEGEKKGSRPALSAPSRTSCPPKTLKVRSASRRTAKSKTRKSKSSP